MKYFAREAVWADPDPLEFLKFAKSMLMRCRKGGLSRVAYWDPRPALERRRADSDYVRIGRPFNGLGYVIKARLFGSDLLPVSFKAYPTVKEINEYFRNISDPIRKKALLEDVHLS